MKQFLAGTLAWSLMFGGLVATGVAIAEMRHGAHHQESYGSDDGHHRHHAEHHRPGDGHRQHHAEHHGGDGYGKHHGGDGYGKHHGGDGYEKHHGGCGHAKDKEKFARRWKKSLTPEQTTQVDSLRVSNAKAIAPLKASMTSIKVDLALLVTAEKPDLAAIQQHVDKMLELKKQVMQQRYAHIAAVREVLTPEQRVSYDMMILNRARKQRGGKRW